MKPKRVKELTVPGYYWWLPSCFEDHPEIKEHWSILSWHPLDSTSHKSGYFVGPIEKPNINKI